MHTIIIIIMFDNAHVLLPHGCMQLAVPYNYATFRKTSYLWAEKPFLKYSVTMHSCFIHPHKLL